jgi:hypothetical protein
LAVAFFIAARIFGGAFESYAVIDAATNTAASLVLRHIAGGIAGVESSGGV